MRRAQIGSAQVRLNQIAAALGVPITQFYARAPEPDRPGVADDSRRSDMAQFLATKQGIQLLTSFLRIQDQNLRRHLVTLMATISLGQLRGQRSRAPAI